MNTENAVIEAPAVEAPNALEQTAAPADEAPKQEGEQEPQTEEKTKAEKTPSKGRVTKFATTDIITIAVAANPKRPGTPSYDRFEAYTTGMTVQAAMDAGVKREDLNWDTAHGFITITITIAIPQEQEA